jgi:hypothetical protein
LKGKGIKQRRQEVSVRGRQKEGLYNIKGEKINEEVKRKRRNIHRKRVRIK